MQAGETPAVPGAPHTRNPAVPNADQLLAKLYALRKDYADDPEDETYIALHHAFLFISYNMGAFKEYVKKEAEKADKE
jgi:hypothetical protein